MCLLYKIYSPISVGRTVGKTLFNCGNVRTRKKAKAKNTQQYKEKKNLVATSVQSEGKRTENTRESPLCWQIVCSEQKKRQATERDDLTNKERNK